MKYFYPYSRLPDNKALKRQLDSASHRLEERLKTLDLAGLGISEYNQRYLSDYLQNLRGTLQAYSYILAWALAEMDTALDTTVFMDYGGGCGMLSMLAKEAGIGTVIYNDIYDISCRDAKVIAKAVQLEAQAYVRGDINDLIKFINDRKLSADIIASCDVIEHIYDIDDFFRKLSFLSSHSLYAVHYTGANNHNPLIRRKLMKYQFLDEHMVTRKEWGHKEIDTPGSFYKIRKEIISGSDPSLTVDEISQIASQTRGLIKTDIEKAVKEYRAKGYVSYMPNHPTNTCDPYTGNWTEHLMDTGHIEKILRGESFEVQIKNGYYAYTKHAFKRNIKSVINMLISLLGTSGIKIAPYYMVYAKRKHP